MFGGIKLKLNPLFLLLLLVLPLAGMVAEALLVLFIIFVHETAHLLVARRSGIPVSEIEIFPFGGVARTEGLLEVEPEVEKRIAWAGPLINLVMGVLGVSFLVNQMYWGWWDEPRVLFFIQANFIMAFFNLVPALPLDGGRILRASLSHSHTYRRATEIAVKLGKSLAVIVFLSGIILMWYGYFNLSLLAAAVFVFVAASKEKHLAVYSFLRSLGSKDREILQKGGLKGEHLVVSEETTLLEILRLFSPRRYHLVRIMDSGTRQLKREVTETVIVEQALKKGVEIPVKRVIN